MTRELFAVWRSVGLTIAAAIFGVIGIVASVEVNIATGLAFIIASLVLWGYGCVRTDITELAKEQTSPN